MTPAPACIGEDHGARRERISTQALAGLLACNVGFEGSFAAVAVDHADRLTAALDGKPSDLLAALAAVVPYAESRAEDMAEEFGEGDTKEGANEAQRPEEKALVDKAWAAVTAAKKLLRENGVVVP